MENLSRVRQKLSEMKAEREAWVASMRQSSVQETPQKSLESQPTLSELKQLMLQILDELAVIKAKLPD